MKTLKKIMVLGCALSMNSILANADLIQFHNYKKSSKPIKQNKIQELETKNANSLETIKYLAARNLELKNRILELEKKLNYPEKKTESTDLLSIVRN